LSGITKVLVKVSSKNTRTVSSAKRAVPSLLFPKTISLVKIEKNEF